MHAFAMHENATLLMHPLYR